MAKSLHLQRLERALEMGPFMRFAKDKLTKLNDVQSSSESDSDDEQRRHTFYNKEFIFNPANITDERKWLYNLMLSESDDESEISDEDAYVREMLKDHVREKRCRKKYHRNPANAQYGYFSVGMLSNHDVYHAHKDSVLQPKKKRLVGRPPKSGRPGPGRPPLASKIKIEKEDSNDFSNELNDIDWEDQISNSVKDEDQDDSRPQTPSGRGRKRKVLGMPSIKAMIHRRRKVWMSLKKEVGKFQRMKANNHKEMLVACKKTATMCQKVARQKAMESQKRQKETIWRAKKLTREMLSYWKRFDRVERENRRRQEKEAEEQRKMDVELVEVKRQQRKLNFLITQTELYAHFMSHKDENSNQEQDRILNQLDESTTSRVPNDNYDSELMKQQAQKNVKDALMTERNRTREFDRLVHEPTLHAQVDSDSGNIVELPQPECFKGVLKGYQLKGMTWLAHLYEQGISGILADEMGLGKTVQSIAFLCHVAENYGVYGPFLIISPASTLHNWQQEMQRFVPGFKVIPYWGSPNQRKILRQFWDQTNVHTKEASFHVVITSYQLVVSDYKYFNRVKWMYMVLDEAQAIKSQSSMRWKLLLGFNCRNRLLLSGTPIQNSMAELWALLHFIMPTLFDSHDEFNEWFSKDIESHAENKTGIDEKQISRLHMILKPFMLRRIKKDVENELSDKIEIMMYCPLTTRQKYLYMALKKKIRIEDLLKATGLMDGHTTDKNFTSNLMNLVMQFRKVCNHPELFERRDIKSPFSLPRLAYVMPRLVFNECRLHKMIPSRRHLIYNRFSVFKAENIHRRMLPEKPEVDGMSFLRFADLSCGDVEKLTLKGLLEFLLDCRNTQQQQRRLAYQNEWWPDHTDSRFLLLQPTVSQRINKATMPDTSVLRNLIFTSYNSHESSVYTFQDHLLCSMQETTDHRIIRSRHMPPQIKSPTRNLKSPLKSPPLPCDDKTAAIDDFKYITEFQHVARESKILDCRPTEMPKFLYYLHTKVQSSAKRLYVESREAAWEEKRFDHCDSAEGWQLVNESVKSMHTKHCGWSMIQIPDKQALVSDAGKLYVLDLLLTRLKTEGHRVLIYSQMTKMIDLLEEYMWHRKHRYMRLDGSSKISARRDMVADFQAREDIFCFLLSTRAGGLGINLTAADTVIFYDSDWNPTVDQQAMDRAHRLGQTKQVTVYRLICKGTIEERILQRAREKSEIQRMVISGGNFKPDTLKPKEVVSLLLDDDEIETKYRQKKVDDLTMPTTAAATTTYEIPTKKRIGKSLILAKETKKQKLDILLDAEDLAFLGSSNNVPSPSVSEQSHGSKRTGGLLDDDSNEALVMDLDSSLNKIYGDLKPKKRNPQRAGNRRPGRPRGTGKKRDDLQSNEPPKPKRGPGRPKTKLTPGPMNKGFRNMPTNKRPYFVKPKPTDGSFKTIISTTASSPSPAAVVKSVESSN